MSIVRIVVTTVILLTLDYFISEIIGYFYPLKGVTPSQLLLIRFSTILFFNIFINAIIDLQITKDKELRIKKDISDLKYAKLETEFNLLKAQINPHFIFNALNTSKSLISENPNEAKNYIIKLSEFMRDSMVNDKRISRINEEIKICENYFNLQKVRFNDSFNYEFKIDEKYSDFCLPYFTFVTLAENAFKHNNFTKEKPLLLKFYNEDDYLIAENNINRKSNVQSTRIGLENLNQRSIQFFNEAIKIIDDDETFKIKIKLKKNENFNN